MVYYNITAHRGRVNVRRAFLVEERKAFDGRRAVDDNALRGGGVQLGRQLDDAQQYVGTRL